MDFDVDFVGEFFGARRLQGERQKILERTSLQNLPQAG